MNRIDVWETEIKYDRLTYGNIVITEQYETESYDDAITCSNAIKLKEVMDDKILWEKFEHGH